MLIVRLRMEPTANLNHGRRSCIMQINGPVNLRWKAEECMENWRWKVEFIKRTRHQIAWEMRSDGEIFHEEADGVRQMNFAQNAWSFFYCESDFDPDSALCKSRWMLWIKRRIFFTVWRQRTALKYPTFPANPWDFWVPEVWLAAVLDCRRALHQARHQWRCWLRQLRGAHRALSVHVERTLPHLTSSHTSFTQVLSLFTTISIPSMAHPLCLASPFLLLSVPLCLFLLPPPLRTVLWARQPDRHGKPVLLRQQGEWGCLRRLHFPHME